MYNIQDGDKVEDVRAKSLVEMSIHELLNIQPEWARAVMPKFDVLCNSIIEKTGKFNTLDAIRAAIAGDLVRSQSEMSFFCLYVGYRAGMMKEGQEDKILVPGKDFTT